MGKADNVEKVLYTRSESNSPDKLEHNIATEYIRIDRGKHQKHIFKNQVINVMPEVVTNCKSDHI